MDVVPLIDVVYQLPMNFDEPLQMNTSIVIQKSNFFVTPPPSHRLPPSLHTAPLHTRCPSPSPHPLPVSSSLRARP